MGKKASQLQDLPLAQQRSACPQEASSCQIIARHCWHSAVLPLCQASEQWPHQILKRGRRLLCANLAVPAPAGAACGRSPVATAAPGLSTRHGPLRAARGRGPAAAAGLQWTCGLDSSAGNQRQTTCSWRRRS